MKYYVLKIKDNKELSVKEDLLRVFKEQLVVIMPFMKNSATIEGNKINFFNRLLPNYLIIGCQELDKGIVEKIAKINNTDGFIYSTSLSGDEPSVLEKDEAEQYLKDDYDFGIIEKTLDGELVVLNGPYSGKTCRIKYKQLDYYSVIVNTRKTPEMKLPIWCLGKISRG